jgi:phosphoribosylanthranilate isomerase
MFVKMCGMTKVQDVDVACQNNVDAIGFIFADSPRRVSIEKARGLSNPVNGPLKVGVFVNEEIDTIRQIRETCNLDIIQLHGEESPDFCQSLGGPIFKAFRAKDEHVIQRFSDYPSDVKILFDSWSPSLVGGTGRQIDFNILDKINDFSRIILAGGLGLENIQEIVNRYHPFGVDINSKVEKSPGIKDHSKIINVMQLLKS